MRCPDRWLSYSDSGRIPGTRFVAHKTPLAEGYNASLSENESFTSKDLLRKHSNIKLVIDLMFTTKYYDREEFEKLGVQHVKIKCAGGKVPKESLYSKFVDVVNNFIADSPQDYLIGVHCTHGVNRTGYFIVRYMIENLGYSPARALRDFAEHRGHAIERPSFVADLLQCNPNTRANSYFQRNSNGNRASS